MAGGWPGRFRPDQAGFTLVELVVVLVLAGILAVVVMPRMFATATFDSLGFYDQAQAGLRLAQKLAMAQRHWVKVADSGGGITARLCAGVGGDGCAPNTSACATAVVDPATGQALSLVPPAGMAFSHNAAYGTAFYFDCEGRPMAGAGTALTGAVQYTLAGAGATARLFSVEPETGYVHP